jgi:hypothetical protein
MSEHQEIGPGDVAQLHVVQDLKDPAKEQLDEQQLADPAAEMDAVTDEQALEQAPPMPQLPTLTIPLAGTRIQIHKEDGETALIVGPVLTSFVLPFNDESARNLARELTGGIEIASIIPAGAAT